MFRHHEFWHPRLFETPYYVSLVWQCWLNRIGIKSLAKANYCLDHGEIGLGSKYVTQLAFDQSYFLPTAVVRHDADLPQKIRQIVTFADLHGYPLILKPDVGCVGKGIRKIHSAQDVAAIVPRLLGDYIVQQFTANAYECGIFFIRQKNTGRDRGEITGINRKHFPSVVGNGIDTVAVLAEKHERFNHHWQSFLQDIDTERVPANGEDVCVSFIGSHTLGCRFTDDYDLLTPALEEAVLRFFDQQPGYNFGRIDVKAKDEAAFKRGQFVIIEVNGVASLPTHMFDPRYSLWESYRILFYHAKCLASIASQHQHQPMDLLSYRDIFNRVKNNQKTLNQAHHLLKM